MVLFLTLTVLVTGLQLLHLRLLKHVLPLRWHRGLPWMLLGLHLPLVVYMALRLSGHATHGLGPLLRPWARMGLYFQALTVMGLAWGWTSEGLWRLWRHFQPEDRRPPLDPARRHFLKGAALAGLGTAAAGSALGASEAYGDPGITRLDLAFGDLPRGLDGLRLAYLSDMHAGPLVGGGPLQRWRDLAQRERPELLLFGGDIVDSLPEEARALCEAFRDFPAPLGRFAVLGNHDYFTDPVPVWAGLETIGVACLENAHVRIPRGGDELVLVGLQDPMARNGRFQGLAFGPGPDPARAVAGLAPGGFRLCLAHRPSMWAAARETGARLTLSGHTHGGQINLLPGLSSARLLGRHTAGLYREGEARLYVSRGLGVVGLPMRLGAKPEIVVITLRRG